jgi:hypothetical protein
MPKSSFMLCFSSCQCPFQNLALEPSTEVSCEHTSHGIAAISLWLLALVILWAPGELHLIPVVQWVHGSIFQYVDANTQLCTRGLSPPQRDTLAQPGHTGCHTEILQAFFLTIMLELCYIVCPSFHNLKGKTLFFSQKCMWSSAT